METIIIVLSAAILTLIIIYFFYDKRKKVKLGKDPKKYIEGLISLLDGKDEVAFNRFRDVVSEDSSNIDAYIRIGNILRQYGKAEKALQVHKDLTLRHGLSDSEKISVLDAVADDYMKLGDFQSARKALEEALKLDNNKRRLAMKLIRAYSKLEDWDGAFKTRQSVAKISSEDKAAGDLAIYKYFQGMRLFDKKKYHDARVVFKEAIHISSGCVPAYIGIGDSYVAENRLDDAVSIWADMIKAVPDDAYLVIGRLKKILFELGKFGVIADICRDILSNSTDNMDARLTLAEYHFKKGEYQLAVEHLKKADENHPESLRPVLDLAKLYLVTGDNESLKELLDKLDERQHTNELNYVCQKCNFESSKKIWFCPACQAVDSFRR